MKPTPARIAWGAVALGAIALGAWQRGVAVVELPPDYDELVYLPAAYDYVERMAPGRWTEIPEYTQNAEHPPMVKLLYAVQLDAADAPEPDWSKVQVGRPLPEDAVASFRGPRWLSWTFGVLQLAALSTVQPLAALQLAFSTYHTKYTAQAYLEAVPGLFAILCVLLFEAGTRRRKGEAGPPPISGTSRRDLLLGSAAFLGLATAAKYPYGLVVALALAPFFVRDIRQRRWWAAYAGLALVTFFLAQPALWPDPIGRLAESVGFHWSYSQTEHVKKAGLPFWQPLYWLTHSKPMEWHGLFATSVADWILLPLAAIGFEPVRRQRPVYAAWAAIGLVFLMLWPTRWPQYTLLILPALAVCAAHGVLLLASPFARLWRRFRPAAAATPGYRAPP